MTSKKEAAAPAPVPQESKPKIQGRMSTDGTSFRRGPWVFTPRWQTLEPQPTAEQLAMLKAERHVQIREQ